MSPQAHQGTGLPAGNLLGLDHFTLRTSRLEETVEFFTWVIGLSDGPRPAFRFPDAGCTSAPIRCCISSP